ncbi:MAG TPA: S8 family serine peptidase, partial [Burkholderiales bacterium]|nr:S8 family serine peptidase [Burkholderiales bacterium]
DLVNGRSSAYDDNGHGTHVTGTAAAVANNGKGIAGIAPGVAVGGVKVLNRAGSGTWSAVASGIVRCADAGSHVESLSLGGGPSQVLADAIAYASSRGVVIVAAAGNGGPCTNCVEYPAKYPAVVAVSCTDTANAFCTFSSEGPEIDLAAPGKNIVSTWAGVNPCNKRTANTCYAQISGTSMSTPHVAGIAALYLSTHPGASAAGIEFALKSGARDLGMSATRQGAGLVQGSVV